MIRDGLPCLRRWVYLNAGTNGPLPGDAARAMQEQAAHDLANPRVGQAAFDHYLALRERARRAAARSVGADPAELALTSSTTQGVGVVVAGLQWAEGDEVVTTTEEHQGVLSPLEVVQRRHGVVVRAVPADDVPAAIGPRTRLVAISHVLWTTGRVLAVAAIAAEARSRGVPVLLDGAQAVGNIAVDAPGSGADFYAFSGQKWLLGPQGSGGLWVHPDRRDQLWPALSGYLNLEAGEVGRFKDTAGRFDQGMNDPQTMAGFAAAVEWVEGLPGGRGAWIERTAANAASARDRLAGVPGVQPVPVPGATGGLVALRLPAAGDLQEVVAALAAQGILVRMIPRTDYLRVSVGAWTTGGEIERLADALAGL